MFMCVWQSFLFQSLFGQKRICFTDSASFLTNKDATNLYACIARLSVSIFVWVGKNLLRRFFSNQTKMKPIFTHVWLGVLFLSLFGQKRICFADSDSFLTRQRCKPIFTCVLLGFLFLSLFGQERICLLILILSNKTKVKPIFTHVLLGFLFLSLFGQKRICFTDSVSFLTKQR